LSKEGNVMCVGETDSICGIFLTYYLYHSGIVWCFPLSPSLVRSM
jgi:hypothetical protein